MRVDFKDLDFPKGLNLHLLSKFLPEVYLKILICENIDKNRKARRIILPSRKLILKVYCHYLVKKHHGDYDAVMEEFKGSHLLTLKEMGINRKEVRRLFEQREKEIKREKNE